MGFWEEIGRSLPSEMDVVQARARRSMGGEPSEQDVMLDRFGTGQEMGIMGAPVSAMYEAAKPIMANVPPVNEAVGYLFGPEQMVDETTQRPSFRQAAGNVGATAAGAFSRFLGGY